jgi:hypothetical protein
MNFAIYFILLLHTALLFLTNYDTNAQLPAGQPIPSNPNSSKEAKCILNYLYSLKSKPDKKIISGQMMNMAINYETAYQTDIVSLFNTTNKWIGIIGSNYQRVPSGLPKNMHETNYRLIQYFRNGGLVTLFCSFSNPWTNAGFNDTTGRYGIMDLIDESKPVHKAWLERLDSVAVGLKELQDYGVVVLYRFFPENNGSWFWWGSQTPELPKQEDWIKLWIHAHDYFSKVKKLNNILWVFAPSAKETANKNPYFKPDMHYYPGNAYVDIVGTSVYNDTLDIPAYEQLKQTGKPIALTEFGPGMVSRASRNYDYLKLLNQIKTKYPDFRYWVSWNDFVTNGDKDTAYYSPQKQLNGKKLLEDSWVVNRNEIDWKSSCEAGLGDGPWNSPLMIAQSTDGINFGTPKIYQDSAGVPSVINWKGDTLACVFQWFRQPQNSPTWDRVAIKFSYDMGFSWTEPKPIVLNIFPQNYQRPFDPTLAVYDNNKLRIYFSSSNGAPMGLDSAINTYSATSIDGVNFSFENGARYDNPTSKVIDPAVIYFKNEWHYLSPAGAPQDGAFHCISPDGINFTERTKYTSDNTHNWTGNFVVENTNELRFYGCGTDIWFNKSSDGYFWSGYTKTNLSGGDPSVVKISDNNYLMIYVGPKQTQMLVPPKVTLVAPINNSQTDSLSKRFVWNGFPGQNDYHLQVSFNNLFLNFNVNDSTRKDTTFVMNSLVRDSSYYWRVRAKNQSGWGEWSDVWRLRIQSKPDSLFAAVPLTEMRESLYKNYPGGLYPNASNERPQQHNAKGIELAKEIMPLNSQGIPDNVNGKIVLLSVGMSNCTQEYSRFKAIADTFKQKNPKLVIVDGAQGGQTASIIKSPDANFWKIIDTAKLPQNKVTKNQVQAIWLKEANHTPTQAFPVHANMLRDDLKAITKILIGKYPNLKLVYLSCRTFGGYATSTLNPEPYAYESGFSVKWLIEQQISGDTSLAFEGTNPQAPWLAWGPYIWGNGPNPRQDNGLIWLRDDFSSDGTHPSDKGRLKVANMLLDFFRTDETTKPWFLANPTDVGNNNNEKKISIVPNPATNYIEISGSSVILSEAKNPVLIFDVLGMEITTPSMRDTLSYQGGEIVRVDISHLLPGVYFVRIGDVVRKFVKI